MDWISRQGTFLLLVRLGIRHSCSSTWAQSLGYNDILGTACDGAHKVWSPSPCFSTEYQPIITARNPLIPKGMIILSLPGQILDGH
ncbi:hypothetical protein F4824DRAFT_468175 [Ustulina deusta]|nr:hypothetical protein F4824DRAFT_468175 [Ustulina deusta]